MIDILSHKLEILAEETDTTAGFIIKLSKSGFETLLSFNEQNFDIIPIGNDLRRLYLSNMLNGEKISESDSYLYLSVERDIKSLFIEKINDITNQESIFLLLFSHIKENYTKEKLAAIRKYIKEINKQIKETIIGENIGEDRAADEISVNSIIRGEWFSKNREMIFSTLLSSYNDLLFVLDENGYILAVSKAGALSLDYSDIDMRGKHLLEFVKTEQKPVLMEALKKTLVTEINLDLEVNLIGKYENEIPFHITCALIKDRDKLVGMLGTGKNLKELNTLKHKNIELFSRLTEASRLIEIEKSRSDIYKDVLADLNRLRNDFVSNLSHEFRTPLASIIGFAETLLSDKDMPEEMRREFDEIILQEGKRLAKLINDILELSRYEQGKIVLNKTDFDISGLLKIIVDDITPTIENKGLILTCSLPKEPAKLVADKEKIRLVLHGILNNSIKYTQSQGRISCMVKNFREEIEVIISDTGTGISEKEFPYIFHKFYHSSKGSKEFIENDIDLVFIKQIIDLHRGVIRVQSEPGKGTTVLIKLPKKLKYK
jgi:PAS domain S-box-containing protein